MHEGERIGLWGVHILLFKPKACVLAGVQKNVKKKFQEGERVGGRDMHFRAFQALNAICIFDKKRGLPNGI